MAVSEQAGPVTDPRECASGREFVRDRLAESDAPLSPAELSEEYDCTNGYMRDILSDLNSEGVAERVTTGRYVLAGDRGDDSGGDTDGSLPDISDDGMADFPGEDTSEDGSDDMPTQDEYRQQHTVSDDEQADVSASSEPTGSDGNTSASAGSDAPDDADADGLDAAPVAPLPMDPKTLGTVLALALGVWLAYRAVGGSDTSEPEEDAGGEQAADADDVPGGGLAHGV